MTPAQQYITDTREEVLERRRVAWAMKKSGKSTRECCRTLDLNNSTFSVYCLEGAMLDRIAELEAQLEQK
jgi:hypothetical protein